jgi:hypothetical protein
MMQQHVETNIITDGEAKYARVYASTAASQTPKTFTSQNIGAQYSMRAKAHGSSALFPDSTFADFHEACIVKFVNPPQSVIEMALARLVETLQSTNTSTATGAALQATSQLLEHVYQLDRSGLHRQAAREVMRGVETSLHKNSLEQANELLRTVDVNSASPRTLSALLRASYRARGLLPSWNSSYKRSWQYLKKAGKSPEKLFIGMHTPSDE